MNIPKTRKHDWSLIRDVCPTVRCTGHSPKAFYVWVHPATLAAMMVMPPPGSSGATSFKEPRPRLGRRDASLYSTHPGKLLTHGNPGTGSALPIDCTSKATVASVIRVLLSLRVLTGFPLRRMKYVKSVTRDRLKSARSTSFPLIRIRRDGKLLIRA